MKVIDQTEIFRKYRGQWVVLDQSRERVLTSAKTLHAALEKFRASRHADEQYSVFKVPTKTGYYVGLHG